VEGGRNPPYLTTSPSPHAGCPIPSGGGGRIRPATPQDRCLLSSQTSSIPHPWKGRGTRRVWEGVGECEIHSGSKSCPQVEYDLGHPADGHPTHKGKRVRQWLKDHASECELVLLPGYAPELNPDELLNQDLKSNVFSMGRPHNQTELMQQARCYLRATQNRPEIVQAYFEEPHVNYAAH